MLLSKAGFVSRSPIITTQTLAALEKGKLGSRKNLFMPVVGKTHKKFHEFMNSPFELFRIYINLSLNKTSSRANPYLYFANPVYVTR
jgi:hypothetical protein